MLRRVLVSFLLTGSIAAFGQLADPNIKVGASGAMCNTSNTSCSGEPNLIDSTGFTLFSSGDPTADVPWYILLAIPGTNPNDAGGGTDPTAPTITATGFTISSGVDAGDFLSTTPSGTDIYDFASADDGGLKGDGSMNSTNMFGTAETTAFGSTPNFFDIFVYTVSSGALTGGTNFDFAFTGTSPPLGTFVAGLGTEVVTNPHGTKDTQPFQTPFTTAGLVDATTGGNVQDTTGGVPEPSSIVLFGTVLLGLSAVLRKKLNRS